MLALIVNPFQSLIDSLPTRWTQLLDRPEPATPATAEAIAFSLTPAQIVRAALEKYTAPEATETDRLEARYTPETLPDYWAMEVEALTEAIATKTPRLPLPQLRLPAAKDEVKPEPTPEPVKVAIATPAPQLQPDGETPNLHDFYTVPNASGYFQVKPHGEGYIVKRWKKTKRQGWEQTTHLIGDHGCDCEQARKKPSSVCCHQKAVKSFELSEKTRIQKQEWERRDNEKSAKVKAELDAIATQRQQDKLNQLIRDEAQQKAAEQAKEDLGLAPHLAPKGDRNTLLIECRDLFGTCSFNKSTGMEFLVQRYDKARLDVLTDAELEDLADHLSANRYQLKKANLKDIPLAQSGLKIGDLCKAKKTGFNYRIKQLNDDGQARLQTLIGNFEVVLPIDRLEAI